MSQAPQTTPAAAGPIEITAADLPLHCPGSRTPAWSSHPRVFLRLQDNAATHTAQAKCPYCGTLYEYRGALPGAH